MRTPDNDYQHWHEVERVRTPGKTTAQDSSPDAEYLAQVINHLTEKLQTANAQIEMLRKQISETSHEKHRSEMRHEQAINRLKRAVSQKVASIRHQKEKLDDQRKLISTLLAQGKTWTGADGSRWL